MRYFCILAFAAACFLLAFTGKEIKTLKISLEIQKGSQLSINGAQVPLFYLSASGIPIGNTFKVAHRNAYKRTIIIFEGLYLGNGKISCKGNNIGYFRPFKLGGLSQGEHSEFLLMDAKETVLATVTYLPYPLEVVAQDGGKLSISYCGEYQYQFEVENLKPNEKITLVSTSGSEKGEFPLTACSQGTFTGGINSKVIGMTTTKCNFTIKRELHSLSLDYISSSLPVSLQADTPAVIFTMDHSLTTKELTEAKHCFE